MKNLLKLLPLFSFLTLGLVNSSLLQAQSDSFQAETGLDGDHFSLEGALELFKNAASPEAFEKALNDSKNNVNNLDLNEDGEVDYIRVEDHQKGELHAIVLQVPFNEKESQDIAVIEIEKTGTESATLQILGDENIYGSQLILEPTEVTGQLNPNAKGGPSVDIVATRIVVNVWAWPSIRYIYRPTYRAYVSPYRWRRYPAHFQPWRPRTVTAFRATCVRRPQYRVVNTHRVVRAHNVYVPNRRGAVVVRQRTTTRVAARPNTRVGTQKRTRVTAAKGKNGTVVRKKTKTTKVRRRN